ncbi:MAG TPA: LysM peptidoglycan-binding domain-containing protein [Mariniflexile sp.]|nr:LysM peptidoglycan-binding domain-containing protein [Mariniflexile sp.]
MAKTAVGNRSYFVEKGDTLYSISKKYNMTVDELKQLNRLSDTSLNIGQELQVKVTAIN